MDSVIEKRPRVSIMVVAYNTASYIGVCLESLRVQTFEDFEVICVNDGSTDGTESIISEYVSKDRRFKLFSFSCNRGISAARNKALSECIGEYYAELDSDDWYGRDTIELAVHAMESNRDCDLVLYDVVCFNQSTGKKSGFESRGGSPLMSGRKAFEHSLDWSIHGYYMVRGLTMQGVCYDETNSVTDENTCRLLFLRSRNVAQCDGQYFYRQHSESIMQKCTVKQFDMLEAHIVFRPIVVSLNEERLVSLFDNYRWTMFTSKWYYYIRFRKKFTRKERIDIEDRLRSVYRSFDYRLLLSDYNKLGFYSFNGHFSLFKLSSWIYYLLKRMLKKL